MKANEAPEKIYVSQHSGLHFYKKQNDNDIEYIRKDAFIKKACEFLRNHIDPQLTIYHEQTWCKRDEFIEKFYKYMRGE